MTTEADIQRFRSEGRSFTLQEGEYGNQYVEIPTGVIFETDEQRIAKQQKFQSSLKGLGRSQSPDNETQPPSAVEVRSENNQENIVKEDKAQRQISPQKTPPKPNKPAGSGPMADTITEALLSQGKKQFKEDSPNQNAQRNSGFYNTQIVEPVPNYNATDGEKVIQGKSNTIIIMGRDRPGSEFSGKGATPNTHVGCIDIIAGLTGKMAREVDNQGQKVLTNKSTQLDAARIYISQRADIDSPEYFNLAEGKVGNLTNRSAIAIKADSVRIIGREGIKLVTSTDTYSGASGQFIGDNIQGIDLIAGNNDEGLQPMVKGDHLAKILDDVVELMIQLQNLISHNLELTAQISATLGKNVPTAIPDLATVMPNYLVSVDAHSTLSKNFVKHKLNYSNKHPLAKYNFRSKYNNVN